MKYKLGQILCDRYSLKKPANQRNYYVVIQEETDEKFLVLQVINSNSVFIAGTSLNPTQPEEDFVATELKASYLLHQDITILDSFFKRPIASEATGYEGKDKFVKFTEVINGDLIGNVYFEIKSPKNTTISGYLYCEFYRKEKFNK